MKKRILALLLAALVLLTACAKGPSWQEQYDLGLRYLSESNYQEAVIAFAAAIAIDEKRPEAYEGLADVYLQSGDLEKARDVLQQGLDKTGDERFQQRLDEMDGQDVSENGDPVDPFQTFEDLTAQEQQFTQDVIAAVMAQDMDAFCALGAYSADIGPYTITWNDYKVYIYSFVNPDNENMDAEMQVGKTTIEIRTENGTGYYARGDYSGRIGEELQNTLAIMASCPCVDWQWNGAYTETRRDHLDFEDDNGSFTMYCTMTGTMQDNVFQGIFTGEQQEWSTVDGQQVGSTVQIEEEYRDGVRIANKLYEDGTLIYSEEHDETAQADADAIYSMGHARYAPEVVENLFW